MRVRSFQICLFFALTLSGALAHGQGFPWDDFKPRTLKEIVNMEADIEQRNQKENNIVFHADILPSRVRVVFIGTARPIALR